MVEECIITRVEVKHGKVLLQCSIGMYSFIGSIDGLVNKIKNGYDVKNRVFKGTLSNDYKLHEKDLEYLEKCKIIQRAVGWTRENTEFTIVVSISQCLEKYGTLKNIDEQAEVYLESYDDTAHTYIDNDFTIPSYVTSLITGAFTRCTVTGKIIASSIKDELKWSFHEYDGEKIDLTEFNVEHISSIAETFEDCPNLKILNFGEQKATITKCSDAITGCKKLEYISMRGLNIESDEKLIDLRWTESKTLRIDVGSKYINTTYKNIKGLEDEELGVFVVDNTDEGIKKANRIKTLKPNSKIIEVHII